MSGYNEVACLMASGPSLAIFRRFRVLNNRNLLCLQGELLHLENNLKDLIHDDHTSGDAEKVGLQFSIDALMSSGQDPERKHQWELTLKIRAKLKEYNEALLQAAELQRLIGANPMDVNTLRIYLERSRDRNPSFLLGREECTWGKQHDEDLVCLMDRYKDKDTLSRLVDKYFMPWYDRNIGSRTREPISLTDSWYDGGHEIQLYSYAESTVPSIVKSTAIILAPLLPTVSIFALYFVGPPLARIGVIMLFTFIFSLTVTLMTRARPVDCFTATAAFAAVLVVFVGNSDCSSTAPA